MRRRTDGRPEFAALRQAATHAPVLDFDQEQRLARLARNGDAAALDQLVRSHLRLVYAMAEDYQRFGASLSDLVAEGALALVVAVRRFEPNRGTRLATYAAHWIRSRMRKYSLLTRRMVGPPSTRRGRYAIANLARVERELTAKTGEAPERDAIAAQLGVSVRELDEVDGALRSRDAMVGHRDGSNAPAIEVVSDDPSPEVICAHLERDRERHQLLEEGFEQLGSRESDVVRARLLETNPPSLSTLAVKLGVSRERVRQIEVRGYQRLRDAVLSLVA